MMGRRITGLASRMTVAWAAECASYGTPFGGSFRRIIQAAPGSISMSYDVGRGQGWQRNIVIDARPHLPANIRQWFGDSRGRWERSTLLDVTNFGPKTDFLGFRENLHSLERWTRTALGTLEYEVTVEDPAGLAALDNDGRADACGATRSWSGNQGQRQRCGDH
jgi:hypothetical protein